MKNKLYDKQMQVYNKLNDAQKECYEKAMVAIDNAYIDLCCEIGPLASIKKRIDVMDIFQEAKDKINELIKRK